jgi:hypothetical protein
MIIKIIGMAIATKATNRGIGIYKRERWIVRFILFGSVKSSVDSSLCQKSVDDCLLLLNSRMIPRINITRTQNKPRNMLPISK